MAKKNDVTQAGQLRTIAPGTPKMEAFLASGYPGMSVDKAQTIIKERRENPALWPYEEFQKAEAFLAAYRTKPIAIDTAPPWVAENKEDET